MREHTKIDNLHDADNIDEFKFPKDKLLTAFKAVVDPYYQHLSLLPFICGLGPRKAQVLVKKITSQVRGCFLNW